MKKSVAIIFLVLLIDQIVKIWVKTHMELGEQIRVAGEWFYISFIENYGMAFGMELGGSWGKTILTSSRLVIVTVMIVFLFRQLKTHKVHDGIMTAFSLIIAGAIGNIIDSVFYGLVFDKGTIYESSIPGFLQYAGLSTFSTDGYAPLMHGCVVDMFYFPIIESSFPDWLPVWGGDHFIFFSPVFNVADASITCGVVIFLIFRKQFTTLHETKTPSSQ